MALYLPPCTIEYLTHTVEGWKALKKRLDYLDTSGNLYYHAVTNESWIERFFGFTAKKGKGNSVYARICAIKKDQCYGFQMRMVNAPFCHKSKTKIRDNGYQDIIDDHKVKLSIKEITNFQDIFEE